MLVSLEHPSDRRDVVESLAAALPSHQVRTGMASVLVESVEPDPHLLDHVRIALTRGHDAVTTPVAPRVVEIPVAYTGADLGDVAQVLACAPGEVAAAHRAQEWSVAMMGFAPGFGYLEPIGPMVLDWSTVQRRDSPRSQVPRGSVAVAAGMSAVYPSAMPGGWHLIGTSTAHLFDPARPESPTRLRVGDSVRFVEERS